MINSELNIILSGEYMNTAWQKIKAKNSRFGIDNVAIEEFGGELKKNITELKESVLEGKYYPAPYLRYYIKKSGGGFRPISILTLKDKLLQTAANIFYTKKTDKNFVDSSYAYRPGKGHAKAIRRVKDFISRKYAFAAHLDIKNYFDTIDRSILIGKLPKYINDDVIMNLFKMWIQIGVAFREKYINVPNGIAQGGVISPLLSNIYLNDFDHLLQEKNYAFVRYSDNILLLGKTEEETSKALEFSRDYLSTELKLKLNKGAEVKKCSEGLIFLGISYSDKKLFMAQKKYDEKIEKFTRVIKNNSMENILTKLSESLEGIKRYYLHFDADKQLEAIAEHIVEKITEKKIKDDSISKTLLYNTISKLGLYRITGRSNNYFVNISKQIVARNEEELNGNGKLQRKLEFRSRKYFKEMYENLNLVVFTPFSTIGKSRNSIVIKNKGKIINEILITKIKSIIVAAKYVTVTSPAIELVSEKGIAINFIDGIGKPYARISSPYFPLSETVAKQAAKLNEQKASEIIKKILLTKVKNQISVLRFFNKSRKGKIDQATWELHFSIIEKSVAGIKEAESEEDLNEFRNKLLGYEGNAAASYWKLFSLFVPEFYEFTNREHRNAVNPVNILLNYGYGVLYNKILNSIVYARLNPMLGFIHRGRKNNPVLAFDLIEPFRAPIVDRTVIAYLARHKKIKMPKQLMPDDIKKEFLKKLFSRLESNFYYRNNLVNFNKLILDQAKNLEKYIMDETKSFKPFLAKW